MNMVYIFRKGENMYLLKKQKPVQNDNNRQLSVRHGDGRLFPASVVDRGLCYLFVPINNG